MFYFLVFSLLVFVLQTIALVKAFVNIWPVQRCHRQGFICMIPCGGCGRVNDLPLMCVSVCHNALKGLHWFYCPFVHVSEVLLSSCCIMAIFSP